jgi:hypothetical protein
MAGAGGDSLFADVEMCGPRKPALADQIIDQLLEEAYAYHGFQEPVAAALRQHHLFHPSFRNI